MAAPKELTIETEWRNHVQIIFKIQNQYDREGAKEIEVSKMMKNFSQMSI